MLKEFIIMIGKGITRIHAGYTGNRIKRDLQSNDPKTRNNAEATSSLIFVILVIVFCTWIWPYLLAAGIIYFLFKLLHQK